MTCVPSSSSNSKCIVVLKIYFARVKGPASNGHNGCKLFKIVSWFAAACPLVSLHSKFMHTNAIIVTMEFYKPVSSHCICPQEAIVGVGREMYLFHRELCETSENIVLDWSSY